MKASTALYSALAGMTLILCEPATAQSQNADQIEKSPDSGILEQIIVTAQQRSEELQTVPISIVNVSGDKLRDADLKKLTDLQTYVPNLTVAETGIGTLLFMRGIGSGANQGFEQSVGTYVDGIYRGRAQQSRIPFLDLDRVEILRGPQSILFGKHTIAGALNITTSKPSNVFGGEITTLYEPSIDGRQVSGYMTGPLSERINGRLAVHLRETDGWMKNLTLNRHEAQRDEKLVRGTLDWNVNSNFDLSLKLENSQFDVVGRELEVIADYEAETGPFAGLNYAAILQAFGQDASVANSSEDFYRSSNGDFSNNEANEFVLTADYYGWGDLTLTSITGYSNYKFDELCDCDFTGGNVFFATFKEDFDQFSQEFRLTSPGNARLDYIVGLSYLSNDLDFFDTLFLTPESVLVPVVNLRVGPGAGNLLLNSATPRTLSQETSNTSLFAQVTWDYNDTTRFTLGGRFTHERKTGERRLTITDADFNPLPPAVDPTVQGIYAGLFNIRNHDLSGHRENTRFLPSLTIQHDIGDNAMAYFTARRGEKSGGFDARSNNGPDHGGSFEFEDELADTLELGTKLRLADGTAELNAALYYTEFDRMQMSSFDGVLGFNVGNAAKAISQGLELDGRWQVTDYLRLSGSLALADFEFKKYYGQCYFGQTPDAPDGINCDYAGMTNQFMADYSATLTAQYRRPLRGGLWLDLTLDTILSDDYMLASTLDPRAVQDAYSKFNGRIAIASADNQWEFALIGRNLTDEHIKWFGSDTPLSGSTFGAPAYMAFVEQGRSVAAQLSFRF